MEKSWRYVVTGSAANGQSWQTNGTVLHDADDAPMGILLDRAMRESFMAITSGKAVYGQPGKGCSGPYEILRILIEPVKQ